MFMVAGLLYGYDGPETGQLKADHYARIQELARRFEEKHGSIVCRELLGLSVRHDVPVPEARNSEYYKKRPCPEIIGDAAEPVVYDEVILHRVAPEHGILKAAIYLRIYGAVGELAPGAETVTAGPDAATSAYHKPRAVRTTGEGEVGESFDDRLSLRVEVELAVGPRAVD
jgi:hypothetical protein